MDAGNQPQDHAGDDAQQLVQIAGVLGLGNSNADEPVSQFMRAAVERAAQCLWADDGTAWEHVTTELFRKAFLTGEQVRAIVAKCDEQTGRQQ